MKHLVSILLLFTYASLVFADAIYFKNGQPIEGELLYYDNFIGFKISNPEYESVWSNKTNGMVTRFKNIPEDAIISHADSQTFVFNKSLGIGSKSKSNIFLNISLVSLFFKSLSFLIGSSVFSTVSLIKSHPLSIFPKPRGHVIKLFFTFNFGSE